MRKLLLTVVASCALFAFAPASALAHHGRHHHAHHARVHHRTFGHDWGQSGSTTQSTSSDQNAGTVQSFTNGVLTILLNDGKTTVSGQVTPDTEIECRAPEMSGMQSHDSGDDNGGGDDQGDNNDQGDDQGQADNDNDDNEANQSCDSSSLTPGTVVHEASLKVSSAGATWDRVELVTASAANNNNDNDNDDNDDNGGD
jgi:hypothetical protein